VNVKRTTARLVLALVAAAFVLTHLLAHAHAQSSLGIGTNEAMAPSTGLFSGWLNWINVQQQGFYRSLTGALKAMRDDGGQMWFMVGLSFAYGVFHAAGPGHGKAVISSYMLANEVTLKRGVMLSFVSAFLQGLTAIVLMALIFLVLRGTAITMTNATWFLEVASFALVTCFGAFLLWQKAGPRVARLFGGTGEGLPFTGHSHAHSHAHAHDGHSGHDHATHAHAGHDHSGHRHHAHAHADGELLALAHAGAQHQHSHVHATAHSHAGHSHAAAHAHHAHAAGEVCATCGHSHAPDPALISGDNFSWKTAWSAIVAVGLRPCSGALIVLSFAFLNGLWAGGLLSVLAMALGTAITVSALATIAVLAKNWAVALAGNGRAGNTIHAAIEIGGAALVFVLGLVLLTASLAA